MAEISKIKDLAGTAYDIKDTTARNHIADTTVHVTASEKSDWNGKYTKPTDGIPASDLAVTIPTSLSQLSSDSSHRTVTDAQISAWDSGGFTDEIILIDVSLKRYDTHRFRIASASTT